LERSGVKAKSSEKWKSKELPHQTKEKERAQKGRPVHEKEPFNNELACKTVH